MAVRNRYMKLLAADNITVVTPSISVASNLLRVDERFHEVFIVNIAHGVKSSLSPVRHEKQSSSGRLRVLVLGQLSVIKGVNLLFEAIDSLLEFADIHLVGCQELGELFSHRRGVYVIPHYSLSDLPTIVANINPDVGLLLSIGPESFSYTLSELMMLGIPPIATRIGSFE
jgi:glycosyltransferase involved in cell wall biosynthesis